MRNTPSHAECFGLHWDGPVAWLLQGRKGSNFVGIRGQCPFNNPKGMCNHLVPTAAPIPDKHHWEIFQKLLKDPLVEVMLPVPRRPGERAYYIEDPDDSLSLYLSCLSRMSSPIQSIVRPAWMVRPSDIERELHGSNIQPWLVTRVSVKELKLMEQLSSVTNYFPRTLILTGTSDVPVPSGFTKLQTSIKDFPVEDLVRLPFEMLGATAIRRFCRREDIGADIESRDERRARMIKERSR